MKREISLYDLMIPKSMENHYTAQQNKMNGDNPALNQVQPFQQNYSQSDSLIITKQPPATNY